MHVRQTLVVAALALAACSSASGSNEISMTDEQKFEPADLSVSAGTTLVFTNDSDEPHTVTPDQASIPDEASYFSSGGLSSEDEALEKVPEALVRPGETFELTLDTPGSYAYFCIPHRSNGMIGRIEVTE